MSKETLDQFLAEDLGTDAARALRVWAGLRESTFTLDRWMDNGRSAALVGVVYESNAYTGTRKLILKLDQVDDDAFEKAEFPRHRRALAAAPPAFMAHLAEIVHDPIHVGDGRWFTFQRIAAGSLRDVVVVTTLLDDVRRTDGAHRFDTDALTATCADVVKSVLADWAESADLVTMTVPEFLDRHLGERLKPGGSLHHLSLSLAEPKITLPGESRPLVNPFRLAQDQTISADRLIRALLGRTHGDLHTENILVSLRPRAEEPAFFLVDLAKYESNGPLARDPVHLLLYVVARSLEGLTPEQQEALLGMLLDPDFRGAHLLPGWLVRFIATIRTESAAWARRGDLVQEWEDQSLLSLLGCSLVLLGRKSTREEDRMWFLRLAARAAEKYLSDAVPNHRAAPASRTRHPVARTVATIVEKPVGSDWIAHLCEHLPAIRQRAEPAGLSSRIDEILTAARLGKDMSEQYADLVRKLGGPSTGLRTGVPGLGDGQAVMGEVYVCEMRCPRQERREPGKPVPRCNVMSAPMPLRPW